MLESVAKTMKEVSKRNYEGYYHKNANQTIPSEKRTAEYIMLKNDLLSAIKEDYNLNEKQAYKVFTMAQNVSESREDTRTELIDFVKDFGELAQSINELKN